MLIGVPVGIALLARRGAGRAIAAAALAAVAVVAVGWERQDDYLDTRYTRAEDFRFQLDELADLGEGHDRAARSASRAPAAPTTSTCSTGTSSPTASSTSAASSPPATSAASAPTEARASARSSSSAVNEGGYDYVVTTPELDLNDPATAKASPERGWLSGTAAPRRSCAKGASRSSGSAGSWTPPPAPGARPRRNDRHRRVSAGDGGAGGDRRLDGDRGPHAAPGAAARAGPARRRCSPTGLLALATLVAISELLGLAGILDGVLLTAACVLVGGGALRLEPLRDPRPGGALRGTRADASEPEKDHAQRDAPAVSDAELWVAVAVSRCSSRCSGPGPALLALDRGIYGGDSLWYHMPFAAHIAQTGSVTELLFTDPLYLNWFYPQVSELLHADGLMLLGNDFLSPLLNLAWLGLALFAAWCCGRPYGAGAPAVAAVAALMSANLLFSRQPGNANNDVVAIALLITSVAVLLNARQATARGPLVVAGLAAGLALGTKLTAVPPVGALTIGVIVLAALGASQGRASRALRAAGAWLAGLAVGGGLWYARNLVVSGTPFPFVDIGPLSKPEELQGREPFSIAHYLTDSDVWGRFFRPALEERLGDLWPLVLLLAVAGVAAWLWRGGAVERMLAAVAACRGGRLPAHPARRLRARRARRSASGSTSATSRPAWRWPWSWRRSRRRSGRRRDAWRIGALAVFGGLTALNALALEPIDTDRVPGALLLALAVVAAPVAIVILARRGVPRTALAVAGLCAAILLAGLRPGCAGGLSGASLFLARARLSARRAARGRAGPGPRNRVRLGSRCRGRPHRPGRNHGRPLPVRPLGPRLLERGPLHRRARRARRVLRIRPLRRLGRCGQCRRLRLPGHHPRLRPGRSRGGRRPDRGHLARARPRACGGSGPRSSASGT